MQFFANSLLGPRNNREQSHWLAPASIAKKVKTFVRCLTQQELLMDLQPAAPHRNEPELRLDGQHDGHHAAAGEARSLVC